MLVVKQLCYQTGAPPSIHFGDDSLRNMMATLQQPTWRNPWCNVLDITGIHGKGKQCTHTMFIFYIKLCLYSYTYFLCFTCIYIYTDTYIYIYMHIYIYMVSVPSGAYLLVCQWYYLTYWVLIGKKHRKIQWTNDTCDIYYTHAF